MHYFRVLQFIFKELASERSTREQVEAVILKTYGPIMAEKIWFHYDRIMGEYD